MGIRAENLRADLAGQSVRDAAQAGLRASVEAVHCLALFFDCLAKNIGGVWFGLRALFCRT